MSTQPKTDLSTGANIVYQNDTGRPPKMRAHRFTLRPGESLPFPGVGNFAYIAQADGPVEIALNEDADFMPWDTALATNYNQGEVFPIVWLRTTGDAVVTGILYVGYKVSITDHRLHQLGELVVKLENQKTNGFSGAQLLEDANWRTLVAPTGAKREVWLSVERKDGADAPVRAWWSVSGDHAKVPAREIGLALDGITRLPFSDRIDIATDADGAGVAVVRYIIVVHSAAGEGDLPYDPAPTEFLAIPPASGPADVAGIVSTNRNGGDIWKLHDEDIATMATADGGSLHVWETRYDFGEAHRIALGQHDGHAKRPGANQHFAFGGRAKLAALCRPGTGQEQTIELHAPHFAGRRRLQPRIRGRRTDNAPPLFSDTAQLADARIFKRLGGRVKTRKPQYLHESVTRHAGTKTKPQPRGHLRMAGRRRRRAHTRALLRCARCKIHCRHPGRRGCARHR